LAPSFHGAGVSALIYLKSTGQSVGYQYFLVDQSRAPEKERMSTNLDELLPMANDMRKKVALAEAEKASAEMRKHEDAEAEKNALIDQLSKPSGVSDEEGIRRGANIIRRAVSAGLTEVQVYRFPNQLCTDRGRAINQMEPGWEQTLNGVPREIYLLWHKHFRSRGYKLKVQIVDFPGGMPGDVGMFLTWD
jgi:hypothetical protein